MAVSQIPEQIDHEDYRLVAYAPGGDRLSAMPEPLSWSAVVGHSDITALRVRYSRHAAGGSVLDRRLTDGLEFALESWDGQKWEEPDGARYLVIDRSFNTVETKDGDHAVIDFQAVSFAWLLSKARSLNAGALLPEDHDEAGKRPFLSATAGQIMATLLQEWQARGGFTYPRTFTSANDSTGATWATQTTIYYDHQQRLDVILDNLVAQEMAEYTTRGRSLRLLNPGTDLAPDVSNSVRLHLGIDVDEAPSEESISDLVSRINFAGGEGLNITHEDASVPAPWGRWEGAYSNNSVTTQGAALAYLQAEMKRAGRLRGQYTRDVPQPLRQGAARPFIDYAPGAWITAPGGEGMERMRVQQIVVRYDQGQTTVGLVLNDVFLDEDIKRARRQVGIVGGSTVGGGSNVRPNPPGQDKRQPAAPSGVVASTEAYLDSLANPRALVSLTWAAVTTAVEGGTALEVDRYEVEGREGIEGDWRWKHTTDSRSITIDRLPTDVIMEWRVRAIGRYTTRRGVWSSIQRIRTAAYVTPPPVPSTPQVSQMLGVISVRWDGLTELGTAMPASFTRVEIAMTTSPTPMPPGPPSSSIIGSLPYLGSLPIGDQPHGEARYFRLRARGRGGVSDWTPEVSITVERRVDTDQIAQEILDAIEDAHNRIGDLDTVLEESQDRINDARTRLGEVESGLEDSRADIDAALARLEVTEQDLGESQEKIDTALSRLEVVEGELHDSQGRLDEAQQKITDLEEARDQHRQDLDANEQRITDMAADLQDSKISLDEARDRISVVEQDLQGKAQEILDLEQEMSGIRSDLEALDQTTLPGLTLRISEAETQLGDAFGLLNQVPQQIETARDQAVQAAAEDAQQKANQAQQAAAAHADAQAEAARLAAIAEASGDASDKAAAAEAAARVAAAADALAKANTARDEAVAAASADATTKADQAQQAAITAAAADAQAKAQAAQQAAATHADAQAEAARLAAIAESSGDAADKAAAAQAAAIAAAAADASAKANAARDQAITTASADATQKANQARDAAEAHADAEAEAARLAAVAEASGDATDKANAARAAAEAAAAADALAKANAARDAAIAAAAQDATTKADQARADAIQAAAADATAKADAARAALEQQLQQATNLIDNPTKTGVVGRWVQPGISHPLSVQNVEFEGRATRALRNLNENAVGQMFSSNSVTGHFDVDATKAYVISFWAWDERAISRAGMTQFYFGASAFNARGLNIPFKSVRAADGLNEGDNANFSVYNSAQAAPFVGQWRRYVGYIMPSGTDPAQMTALGTSVQRNAVWPADARYGRIRILNYGNASGDPRFVDVLSPTVVEVDPQAITQAHQAQRQADQAVADAAAAQFTADAAMASADGKNRHTYSDIATGPGPTPPPSFGQGRTVNDVHRNRDIATGEIYAEFRWTGSAWQPVNFGDAILRSLDVGKLTAGTANIQQAVIQKMAVQIATIIELHASAITAGTIDSGRINVSELAASIASVIQLNASAITSGTINTQRLDAQQIASAVATIIDLDASRITSGQIDTNRLNAQAIAALVGEFVELSASQITSGQILAEQIDVDTLAAAIATVIELNAGRITSGIIDTARLNAQEIAAQVANIIELNADRIISGTIDTARLNAQEIAAQVANVIELNASRITSGQIDTERLNAQQIAAAVGSFLQLDAGSIVSGTIDTQRLNAQEIAGALGNFLQVTAENIVASQAMSAKLGQFLQIDAGMVNANEFWADNAWVGAARAQILRVGGIDPKALWAGTDEIVPDPMFLDADQRALYPASPTGFTYATNPAILRKGQTHVVQINGASTANNARMPISGQFAVTPGQKLSLEVWGQRNGAADFTMRLQVVVTLVGGGTSLAPWVGLGPSSPSNTAISASGTVEMPNGAVSAHLAIAATGAPTAGTGWITEVSARRAMASVDDAGQGVEVTPQGLRAWTETGEPTLDLRHGMPALIISRTLRTGLVGEPSVILRNDAADTGLPAILFTKFGEGGGQNASVWLEGAGSTSQLNLRSEENTITGQRAEVRSVGGLQSFGGAMRVGDGARSDPNWHLTIEQNGNIQMHGVSGGRSTERFIRYPRQSGLTFQPDNPSGTGGFGLRMGVRGDGLWYLESQILYSRTVSVSPNVYVNANGTMFRTTSVRAAKTDVETLPDLTESIMSLRPVTYRDRGSVERGEHAPTLLGLIAEEVEAAGVPGLTSEDLDGSLNGVQYERLSVALLPIVQSILTRLTSLEAQSA